MTLLGRTVSLMRCATERKSGRARGIRLQANVIAGIGSRIAAPFYADAGGLRVSMERECRLSQAKSSINRS